MTTLKDARERLGVKKGAVAEAMGVSFPTYQRYESGESDVPADKLKAACDFLRIDVCDIEKSASFFTLQV